MKNVKGFTLIELMIVVAIIGIIAAFGTSSYNDSVRKSKRADAKASLMDISAQFERCFTMNGQYTTTVAPNPIRTCTLVTSAGALNAGFTKSTKGYYNITLGTGADALTGNTFMITATPVAGFVDTRCTSFSLTSTGAKTSTPPGNVCW